MTTKAQARANEYASVEVEYSPESMRGIARHYLSGAAYQKKEYEYQLAMLRNALLPFVVFYEHTINCACCGIRHFPEERMSAERWKALYEAATEIGISRKEQGHD
jgi:hypothetical protein